MADLVTPMPYGIRGEGDRFEIVIPKGTKFPMDKPATTRIWTPAANLRRLSVPIYAGLDPIASRNELQATVWIELPENLPAGTPVDVAFSLDEDGILKEVLVELKDGSGIKVKSILGRGDKARDRLENKLEELRKRKEQARGTLDPSVEREWEALYEQATRALNANDTSAASSCAVQMEGLVQAKEPEWRLRAQGLCSYAAIVLGAENWREAAEAAQIRSLIELLRGSMERDDEECTANRYLDLEKALNSLTPAVKRSGSSI
jgi:molecular chaperone DnaK (HSP70)